MKKLVVTVGVSGSGKTFWAEQFCAKNRNYKNLNRDDFRRMLSGNFSIWNQGFAIEETITKVQEHAAEALIKSNFNVIISDTNLSLSTLNRWKSLASRLGAEFEIKSFVDVSLDLCLERDAKRENSVSEAVIRKQYAQLGKLKLGNLQTYDENFSKLIQDSNLPKAVVCDLDGTLALFEKEDKTAPSYRNPYDASTCENDDLNVPVASVLKMAYANGYAVILVSGRDSKYRQQTWKWLEKHTVSYTQLIMRTANDSRKDSVIKYEIYKNSIVPNYYVEFVMDDRLQVSRMVHAAGLTLFRVGDPDADF